MDEELRRLVERQHGVVRRDQLLEHGLSAKTIDRWLAHGRVVAEGGAVYRASGAPPTWTSRLWAAHLRHPRAVVSHRAAARTHGLPGAATRGPLFSERIEMVLPPGCASADRSIAWRRSRLDVHRDVALVGGLPVTSVVRTIADLAGVVPAAVLERLVDDSLTARRADIASLEAHLLIAGTAGRRGGGVLRRIVEARDGGLALPESELERRFLALVREARLPRPVLQFRAPWLRRLDGRVDFAWPPARLVVEVNGRKGHSSPSEVERDLRRAHAARDAGWQLETFVWAMVERDREYVLGVVRRRLAAGATGPPGPTGPTGAEVVSANPRRRG
ncbi:MAG: type IV toxin-antitoxin system AbiEi family antitoxin domain-containing protein [Acidimicrobiales bacterium]